MFWPYRDKIIHMDSSIKGKTLAERYPFLLEDAEDISYRMYDLFIRQFPEFKSLFNESREFHIQLFILLINCPANFESSKYSIHPHGHKALKVITNHPFLVKRSNLLKLNRHCFANAIQDVLFDEAHPQLIRECKGIYDEFCSRVKKNAA